MIIIKQKYRDSACVHSARLLILRVTMEYSAGISEYSVTICGQNKIHLFMCLFGFP